MIRTIMRCGVVKAWLSGRMPGTVLASLILLINRELRLIELQPLVWSGVVTAAAALTPARGISDGTSTSLRATPLMLTLHWHRLSRSILRGSTQKWLHLRQRPSGWPATGLRNVDVLSSFICTIGALCNELMALTTVLSRG